MENCPYCGRLTCGMTTCTSTECTRWWYTSASLEDAETIFREWNEILPEEEINPEALAAFRNWKAENGIPI
jgi:hypothetical protein